MAWSDAVNGVVLAVHSIRSRFFTNHSEFAIMESTSQSLLVPLSHLIPSRFNVRRHPSGTVEELAALIASQGLLHHLIVTEPPVAPGRKGKATGKAQPRFAVVAGRRRLRALQLLQAQGRLPEAHEVQCEWVPPERAVEVNIAESCGREALHPADEFDAFKALIDGGKGIEDVAALFGVSPVTVQRRLKLAAVPPALLNLYREGQGGITLDHLMALAVSDDPAAQERAWFEAQPWERDPSSLRRKLMAGAVAARGNSLVRFVGIEAYEAAGGVVRRDLFDDAQERLQADPALLQSLAAAKLEAIAAFVRAEGWVWVDVGICASAAVLRQMLRCLHDLREATRQDQAELDDMATRSAELDRQAEALGDAREWCEDEAERIELETQCIAARRKVIENALAIWAPEMMTHAGAAVSINAEGEASIVRGLMRGPDRKAVAASAARAYRDSFRAEGDGVTDPSQTNPSLNELAARTCRDVLAKRLAAHRIAALQVELFRNTPIALAALAQVFVQAVFLDGPRGRHSSAMQIVPKLAAFSLDASADDLKGSRAAVALDAAKASWKVRTPSEPAEWFGWLVELPQAALLDLLALCAALTVSAWPGSREMASANVMAQAVQLDMADWWEPTAQSYLSHIPKSQIVETIKEVEPGQSIEGAVALKKDALVALPVEKLAGKRWLPQQLRQPG